LTAKLRWYDAILGSLVCREQEDGDEQEQEGEGRWMGCLCSWEWLVRLIVVHSPTLSGGKNQTSISVFTNFALAFSY